MLLLLARLGYSTVTPTNIVVIEGDTVAIVPIERLERAVILIIKGERCQADAVLLHEDIADRDSLLRLNLNKYNALQKVNSELVQVISSKDKQLDFSEQLIKQAKKNTYIVGGVSIIILIIVGLFS
jgi:hypothetical protein